MAATAPFWMVATRLVPPSFSDCSDVSACADKRIPPLGHAHAP